MTGICTSSSSRQRGWGSLQGPLPYGGPPSLIRDSGGGSGVGEINIKRNSSRSNRVSLLGKVGPLSPLGPLRSISLPLIDPNCCCLPAICCNSSNSSYEMFSVCSNPGISLGCSSSSSSSSGISNSNNSTSCCSNSSNCSRNNILITQHTPQV